MSTVYISPTGDDSTGNGTSGNPWKTLTKAVAATSAGDTIRCLSGTYDWSLDTSLSISTQRTITADNGDPTTTIFDAGGAGPLNWKLSGSALTTFSNLQFANAASGVGNIATFAPVNNSPSNVLFQNCIFDSITGGMILRFYSFGGSSTMLFKFQSCLFNNCDGSNGYFSTQVANAFLTLYNNTFYVDAASTPGIVDSANGTLNVEMKNNIIMNGSGVSADFGTGATYSGGNNDIVGYSSGGHLPGLSGDINSDPLFVDAANGNFNLRPNSPCIGTGVTI